MKKEIPIIKIDDRKTVDYGIFCVELYFMHYLSNEEFAYCKQLLRIVRGIGGIYRFKVYKEDLNINCKSSNTVYYRIPHNGLTTGGIELTELSVGIRALNLEGLATLYYHKENIFISVKDLEKVINISQLLTDSEFKKWEKTENRNLLYELAKTREINNKLCWDDNIMLDVFRRAVTEIKKFDRKDFYRKNKKMIDIELSANQYSEKDIRKTFPQEYDNGKFRRISSTNNDSCCFILDDIEPIKYGAGKVCYSEIESYIIYDAENKQMHVVLLEGMIDVIERIGWYDKEIVHERKLKKEYIGRKRKAAREDIACLLFLVLALIGLAVYLTDIIKL